MLSFAEDSDFAADIRSELSVLWELESKVNLKAVLGR